jgi:hypothetical protein
VRILDEANENILLEFACSRIGFKESFGRLTSRRLNFGARIAVYLKDRDTELVGELLHRRRGDERVLG